MRLDQWLWAVRLYKTRGLAVEAIKGGHVKVGGACPKPAHKVKLDERVAVGTGVMTRTLRVVGLPPSRVGAKLVAQFAEELTPEEEFEKQRAFDLRQREARPRGMGRPTKRERRRLDELSREQPL